DHVDDVDHAIGALDVGLDHLRPVDGHSTILDGDRGGAPLDRLHPLSIQADDVGGHRLLRDDVVLQDRAEVVLVLGLEQASTVPSGSSAKASSVGAFTVDGPSPLGVSTSLAALTVATSVLKLSAPAAVSTMSFFSAARAGMARLASIRIPRILRMLI